MGILKRLGKLITADIHGMLDHIEDPVDICKQAVRDMEEELAAQREALQERQTRIESIILQEERVHERIRQYREQQEICVRRHDDALLRGAVRRTIEQEKVSAVLAQQRDALRADAAKLERQVAEYAERLAAVREKLSCLADAGHGGSCGDESGNPLSVSEDEVELAVLKAKAQHAASATVSA